MEYVRSFIQWGGSIVYQLPPEHVRDRVGAEAELVRHNSSTDFCWYLSPEHNFVELITLIPLFIIFLVLVAEHVSFKTRTRLPLDPRGRLICCSEASREESKAHTDCQEHTSCSNNVDTPSIRLRKASFRGAQRKTGPMTWERRSSMWYIIDVLLCISFLGAYTATVTFKALTGRMLYLLQPCHIANALLLVNSVFPGVAVDPAPRIKSPTGINGDTSTDAHTPRVRIRRRIWSSIIFAYIVDTWYGSLGALMMPDTRGLLLPGEVFSFFFQHTLLTLVPPYYLFRGRFEVPLRFGNIVANWAFFGLLHFALFLPLSLYLGDNINFIVHPPPGFDVFGWAYRLVCTFGTLLIMLASRYTIMKFFSRLTDSLRISDEANVILPEMLRQNVQVRSDCGGLAETYILPYHTLEGSKSQ
eukprot:gb/GECG01009924.1/.p1 GENE.gb/GECG01009924.1/~~gb/GECG01009924.1/.p1  ORF type:complete len:415 (+),score=21.86 gb/GECG01009924.1/:1-1245(+)